ncbi:hypothetical protein A2160_01255 [Candidatus Beckwithbacteria bacterium RBG_13_42_9]|uniref:Uncharacterized protein n=1 Tax=Candidatus Beckwithbacteria bacterium RBG_13_42_9 TaxID=1797457 RepID=A0A1F5E483_9BACT|nr:MAG: hypothetical protein A2160_01255 [Candidatus Beckwithbacteria bacterium RBG_13_42_9]
MKIILKKIPMAQLKSMAEKGFGNLVKAVVDVEKKIMAVDGELHADEEALLLENGSKQENLWGINLYPGINSPEWIEFDSMINLHPKSGNLSRGVENPQLRKKIVAIVSQLIEK